MCKHDDSSHACMAWQIICHRLCYAKTYKSWWHFTADIPVWQNPVSPCRKIGSLSGTVMFKKLAAAVVVINEIEALLGVIESAFFHTRDCWILEGGEREGASSFFSTFQSEKEKWWYTGGAAHRGVVWSGTAVSTVFSHAEIWSQASICPPYNLLWGCRPNVFLEPSLNNISILFLVIFLDTVSVGLQSLHQDICHLCMGFGVRSWLGLYK